MEVVAQLVALNRSAFADELSPEPLLMVVVSIPLAVAFDVDVDSLPTIPEKSNVTNEVVVGFTVNTCEVEAAV
jgi:hypothetical protein